MERQKRGASLSDDDDDDNDEEDSEEDDEDLVALQSVPDALLRSSSSADGPAGTRAEESSV